MPSYIALRLISAVAMALFASLVIFLISNFVPGDPVLAQLGDILASDPVVVAQWRAKWGLDLPLWERYGIFLRGLLHGDLGQSIATRRPVLEDIVQFAPATVELATISFVMALALGIPLGTVMSRLSRARQDLHQRMHPTPKPDGVTQFPLRGVIGRDKRPGEAR